MAESAICEKARAEAAALLKMEDAVDQHRNSPEKSEPNEQQSDERATERDEDPTMEILRDISDCAKADDCEAIEDKPDDETFARSPQRPIKTSDVELKERNSGADGQQLIEKVRKKKRKKRKRRERDLVQPCVSPVASPNQNASGLKLRLKLNSNPMPVSDRDDDEEQERDLSRPKSNSPSLPKVPKLKIRLPRVAADGSSETETDSRRESRSGEMRRRSEGSVVGGQPLCGLEQSDSESDGRPQSPLALPPTNHSVHFSSDSGNFL